MPLSSLSRGVELGYAEITANPTALTGSTATADISGLTTTVTVGSRPIYIEAYIPWWQFTGGSAPEFGVFYIRESTTTLTYARITGPATNNAFSAFMSVRLAPSVGSHTYLVSWSINASGSTLALSIGATAPAYISVREA